MSDDYMEMARHLIISTAGGLVRELKLGGSPKVRQFLRGGIIAVFCGTIAHYLCKWRGTQSDLSNVIVALSAYSGMPLLDFGASRVRKLMRRMFEPETDTKPKIP